MNTFTANQELSERSIGDHNCIFTATVLKRTAKTITIIGGMIKEPTRVKIHVSDDGEYVFPYGQYSMAPRFKA